MPQAALATLLGHLRHLSVPRLVEGRGDAQLLDEFLRQHDAGAFASLLRRHGPMVLGICRRVLRHAQDAEDAFQATFLVLVRRGASVRRRDSLAGWLYGVALRTARRAKLDAARRRTRDERAARWQEERPSDDVDWRDLRAVLDEEIAALPEKYRAPLVLCHLQGHTHVEAARRLRLPPGSLSKRLARARGLLRGRLLRRGIALSAAALLTVLAGQAGAAVSPLLARAATGNALLALAGSATAAVRAAALADGVSRAMFAGRVGRWAIGLAVAGLLIGGGMLAGLRLAAAPPPGAAPAQAAPAAPPANDPPRAAVVPRRDRKALGAIKRHLLLRGGGNDKSEAAVAAGLLWIVKQQAADGHWPLDAPRGQKNDVAGTAFGLLPLLGAGHTHTDDGDPFAKNVRRGLDFLLAGQKNDGDLGGGAYPHALASQALFQAYALTGDPKLAAPARSALDYIVKGQNTAGGWGYTPGSPRGDLSVTSYQLAALHDARAAGLDVPQTALDAAARFVQSCRAGDGYAYQPSGPLQPTPTMTAAGLLSLADAGGETNTDEFRRRLGNLIEIAPASAINVYTAHLAADVLRRHGRRAWPKWNATLRDGLVARQEADGGWPTKGEPFAETGGRLMISSLTLLTLEVYYREELALAAASRPLKANELEGAWSDLSIADPIKSRRAVWALARSPKLALPLLKEALALAPAPAVDDKRIARLIADLDDDSFEVREGASAALAKLGGAAGPALRRALERTPSAEVRRRLEALVAELDKTSVTPQHRRALRAVEVLEEIGTPEAEKLLARLAEESPDAELAAAAKAALKRMAMPTAIRP
jgi:RNA polymerase sigma factor (sigma-70 family)